MGTSVRNGALFGTKFWNAFDVKFRKADDELESVWGSSWGVSTRLVGALVMTHSDDIGLVLPPRVAPVQVLIVAIPTKKKSNAGQRQGMQKTIDELHKSLKQAGIRVKVDDRENVSAGVKFFEWERKGVPLRIKVGPRDVQARQCVFKYLAGNAAVAKQTIQLDVAVNSVCEGLGAKKSTCYRPPRHASRMVLPFRASMGIFRTKI